MNKLWFRAGILLVVLAGLSFLLTQRFESHAARFNFANTSDSNLVVEIGWREKSKVFSLRAAEAISLNISGEASMEIIVSFPSGKTLKSQVGYFTAGMTVNVALSTDEIAINGELGQNT